MTESSVRVALRVRPLVAREVQGGCHDCVTFLPHSACQIVLGRDKSFSFDYVLGPQASQQQLYDDAVRPLVDAFLQGYHATVLAYGQTGSGKTYSMGSGFDTSVGDAIPINSAENKGIIPRAVRHIFEKLEEQAETMGVQYDIRCSFLELYNEELVDLLDPQSQDMIRFRDDTVTNSVEVIGVKEVSVSGPEELQNVLYQGSLSRTTASTNMNANSSRSHAIFTIQLRQKRPSGSSEIPSFESLSSKFHFVDLAGSERLKSTQAVGERAKEGVNINLGLLALGNVISALGDESRKVTFVNYRDSKLTRLLQNSLGGNSRTLMVACVSPSDSNFGETLNTLKYANRARNIKNKVMINQDLDALEVTQLRKQIQVLQQEILELKLSGGNRMNSFSDDALDHRSPAYAARLHRNTQLEDQLKQNQAKIETQRKRITELMEENMLLDLQLTQGGSEGQQPSGGAEGASDATRSRIEKYAGIIEDLRNQLETANGELERLRHSSNPDDRILEIIEQVKRDLEKSTLLDAEDMDSMVDMDVLTPNEEEGNDDDERGSGERASLNGESPRLSTEDASFSETKENSTEDLPPSEKSKILDQLQKIEEYISEKESLVAELERLNELEQQYQNKMYQLDQERRELQQDKETAMKKLRTTASKNSAENQAAVESLKENYERKLKTLVDQMKSYQKKYEDTSKRLKQFAQMEQRIPTLQESIKKLKSEKEMLIGRTRREQQQMKELRDTSTKQIKTLSKLDMEKSMAIRRLQKDNERLKYLLKLRIEETTQAGEKIRRLQKSFEQKFEELRKSRRAPPPLPQAQHPPLVAQTSPTRSVTVGPPKRKEKGNVTVEIPEVSLSPTKNDRQRKADMHKLIDKCVVAQETDKIMQGLLSKRERLFKEKQNVLHILSKGDTAAGGSSSAHEEEEDNDDQDLREQLEGMESEIHYVNAKISEMQNEVTQSNRDFESSYNHLLSIIQQLSVYDARRMVLLLTDDTISERVETRKKEAKIDSLKTIISELETSIRATALEATKHYEQRIAEMKEQYEQMIHEYFNRKAKGSSRSKSESSFLVAPPNYEFREMGTAGPDADMEASLTSSESLIQAARETILQIPEATTAGHAGDARLLSSSNDGLHADDSVRTSDVFARLTGTSSSRSRSNSMKTEVVVDDSFGNHQIESTFVLRGHKGAVFDVAVKQHFVYTASQDSTVKIWDLNKTMEIATIAVSDTFVRSVKVKENLIFTASDSLVKIWDSRSGSLVKTLSRPNRDMVSLLALNPQGTHLFSAATDNTVCMWDLQNGFHLAKTLRGHHRNVVTAFEFPFHGSVLVTGSKDRSAKMFEMPHLDAVFVLEPPHYDAIQCMTMVGSHHLITGGGSQVGFLKKWSISTKLAADQCRILSTVNNASKESIQAMASCHGGSAFFTASKDGTLKLWKEDLSCMFEIRAHESSINSLTKSDDESLLFTASNDKTVRMWKLAPSPTRSPTAATTGTTRA